MNNKDDGESDSGKTFLDILQVKGDSDFKFFQIVEDTIRGIIVFFFQVIMILGLMLLRPLHFGKNIPSLHRSIIIPQPLTFLAFSAVIASIGFRRLIASIQLWFCTSGIIRVVNSPEDQTPVWFKNIIFMFCRGIPESFDGISKPDVLSSLRQINFQSMLFMAIPITLITLSFGICILFLFKPQRVGKRQQIINAICYSSGYQLLIFAIVTLWFSERAFDCIFRDFGQSFVECLGRSNSWFLELILPTLMLYAVIAPVPILYGAVAKYSETKQNLSQSKSDKCLTRFRNDKVRRFFRSILSGCSLFLEIIKKVFLILMLFVFSSVLLVAELITTVITERMGFVEPIGIRAFQNNEEPNEQP